MPARVAVGIFTSLLCKKVLVKMQATSRDNGRKDMDANQNKKVGVIDQVPCM